MSFHWGICLSLILVGSVLPLLWSGDERTLERLKISEAISEEREKLKLSLSKKKRRERITLACASDPASPFPFNNHQLHGCLAVSCQSFPKPKY